MMGKKISLTVAAVIQPKDPLAQKAMSGIILADIATAQEVFSNYGRLSHIDLRIDKDIQQTTDKIRKLLPDSVRIENTQSSNKKAQRIISSFQLNLGALSLLAILIGAFIIYDTVTFSVVRRRQILGILRSIGATKRGIFAMILGETLVMSIIGLVCGFLLGIFLGKFAVIMVTQTINDLYFTLTVTDFSISYMTFLKALLALVIAGVAAVIPAMEAAKIPPVGVLRRSLLESKIRSYLPRFCIAGVFGLALGGATLYLPSKSLFLGFLGIFFVILGATLFIPAIVHILMKFFTTFLHGRSVIWKIAPRNIQRSLSRTSVAIAALTVAVSCLIAMNIMIGSFRTTFIQWIDSVLTADIFVSGDNKGISRAREFPANVAQKIASVSGVKSISTSRLTNVKSQNGDMIKVNAVTRNISSRKTFLWTDESLDQNWNRVETPCIVVSEPFAYRYNVKPEAGHQISLFTDRGIQSFTIAGVSIDYSSDRGQIIMADKVYRHYWKDDKITAIAVFLETDFPKQQAIDNIEKSITGYTNLVVNPSTNIRKIAIDIFDRTFAITFAMQFLVGIVAFIGIISTLMALQLERKKEIGILRANGMTPKQLRRLVFCETGLMGGIAGVVSIPLGFVISLIFVYVINVRSFGWTMQFFPNIEYFVQGIVTAVIAATLAGAYPAWRFTKTNIANALREE